MPPIPPAHRSSRRVRREITQKQTPGGSLVAIIFLLFFGGIAFAMQRSLPNGGLGPPASFRLLWNLITSLFMLVAVAGIAKEVQILFTGEQRPNQIVEVNEAALTEPNAAEPDIAARLKKLDDLLQQELISRDEYQTKRAELLACL